MLELEDAQARILSQISPLPAEKVSLSVALNRYLAEKVTAAVDLPLFDNSAMDGYAVRASDVALAAAENPASLRIVGKVAAGENSMQRVENGSAIRIFTGSPLPADADAVVMQEDTRIDEKDSSKILVTDSVKPWENVRFRGEDVKARSVVGEVGDKLSTGRIGLLGALGVKDVSVRKQPVVGLLATGSELIEAGNPLLPGKIYESNRVSLGAMAVRASAIAKNYPIINDSLEQTTDALRKAFAECDCVVTSGGVSVGEFDFVKLAFATLGGELGFWRVSIRPGKPFVFGQYNGKYLFGVPGNPVSALVTFFLLVRPALLRMQGAHDVSPSVTFGTLSETLSNTGDRRHFVRVSIDASGRIQSTGTQASHILSSLAEAHGLVDVPAKSMINAGETARVLLWD